MRHLVLFVLCVVWLGASEPTIQFSATGPAAAAQARSILLRQWTDPGTNQVIIGQNADNPDATRAGYAANFTTSAVQFGRMPLICGADLGWDQLIPAQIADTTAVLIEHWRRGGLVTLVVHPANPSTGGAIRSPGADLADILTSGSAANQRWMHDLSMMADALEVLRQAGVAVIWRPFPEANGNWFWWSLDTKSTGKRTDPALYHQLWRHMYAYFTTERKLDNLIWGFTVNAEIAPEIVSGIQYYPGSEVVDLVSMSCYAPVHDATTLSGTYNKLITLGKPFAVAEIGPDRNHQGQFDGVAAFEAILTNCPQTKYVLWWHSWDEKRFFFNNRQHMSIIENPRAAELLHHPRASTLSVVKP